MSEDTWPPARLIPTGDLSGPVARSRRAGSALLAVLGAVPEFGRALTQPFGAPAGPVRTFAGVPLGSTEAPGGVDARGCVDGLIRISRGRREWTALVAVRTGRDTFGAGPVEEYLDRAREHCFDAVITISNELPAGTDTHPTPVDPARLKRVALYHLSWLDILTDAVLHRAYRAAADPEQSWILGELVGYLAHPESGTLEFTDMGPAWAPVRAAVAGGTLRPAEAGATRVAQRFDALLRYVSLRLGRRLGAAVLPALARRDLADPVGRTRTVAADLAGLGRMTGGIQVPDAVAPLRITADLRAGQLTCEVELDAPREGRPATQVNWLARQLRNAPGTLRVEGRPVSPRGLVTAGPLYQVRENPALLTGDSPRELRAFRIAQSVPLAGPGEAFVDTVVRAVDDFHADVLRELRPWTRNPARLGEPVPAQ